MFRLFVVLILCNFCFSSDLDGLTNYSVIEPQFGTVNHDNDLQSRSQLSFKAFDKWFVLILKEVERPPGIQRNIKLLDSFGNDWSDDYFLVIKHYEASFGESLPIIGSFTIDFNAGTIIGFFHLDDDIFFVEPVNKWNQTIIYKASDVQLPSHIEKLLALSCLQKPSVFEFIRMKRAAPKEPVKKNRCEMKLIADYEFYKVIGNKNYHSAARHLINVIERVNKLFTAVDFGLNENSERLINLGIVIKEIKIFDRPSQNPYHFNSENSTHNSGLFLANETLESFSKEEGANSTCATILLTGKDFDEGILGLANMGNATARTGICFNEPVAGYYTNTAVVTVKKRRELMITRIFDLVFAHELGHLWGSEHDGTDCVAENYSGGRFIMHESTNTGYDQNNYRFSNCSILSMFRFLYTIQPRCFVEEQKFLCGNGLLEPGEECDAGGRYADSEDVSKKDSCCTSDCRLRKGALCSPRHSDCCSDKCDYLPKTHLCVKQNNDTCRNQAYCPGNSPTCPEPPNAVDGTTCSDEGKCQNGTCISFCEINNRGDKPCICENVSDSCYRCCKKGENGKCRRVKPDLPLKDGSICILGYCKNKFCEKEVTDVATHFWKLIKNINKTPGNKLFGDYLVFVILVITLFIWIPISCCVCNRDRRKREEAEKDVAGSQVEYVREPKKIVRQNAVSESTA